MLLKQPVVFAKILGVLGVFVFAANLGIKSPAYAEDFLAQVDTYDQIKEKFPKQKFLMEAFEHGVQQSEPPLYTPKPGVSSPVKISVIFPGNQVSDYWRRSVVAMKARLEQAKVPFVVNSLFTASATEIRKQEIFIQKELRNKPDYLLFTLDALRHKMVIERIIGRGGTKLILQNITTPVRAWESSPPFLYSGFDHEVGSKRLAEEFLKRVPGSGKYAVFFGPKGYVSQMRGDTFVKYMNTRDRFKLVKSYYVGFDRKRARQAALRLLEQHHDLKFIYACSTDIALGIIDALKERKLLGKIKVNGWGGGSAELESLAKGELDFTVMRMNDDNGVAVADAIILDQNGKGDKVPVAFSGDMQIVTQADRPEDIERLKKQAFRYSD